MTAGTVHRPTANDIRNGKMVGKPSVTTLLLSALREIECQAAGLSIAEARPK